MANSGNNLVKDIKKEEKVIEKIIVKQQPSFWMILSITLLIVLAYLLGSKNALISNFSAIPSPSPTPIIFTTPNSVSPTQAIKVQNTNIKANTNSQIECIGPDGKHFQTTMEECKNLNEKWGKPVDYMVDCTIHPDCGGGVVHMSKSQCDKPCSGKTVITNPVAPIVSTSNNSNKTAVYVSYGGYTVYCPAQNVGAVMQIASSMESKKTEWAKNYNQCSDLLTSTDSCWVNCKSTHTWANCNYGTPEYKSCSDAVSASYSSCINLCPSISSKCDYVYTEQRNMSNQINTLCK